MNPNPGKKELSMEVRLVIAFVLMALVLFVTPYFYKQVKVTPEQAKSGQANASPGTPAAKTESAAKPPAPTAAATPAASQAPSEGAPPEAKALKAELYTIDTDVYRIVFSNKGAVATSWILKGYKDNAGKPVELVNPAAVAKIGGPFAMQFKSQGPSTDVNQALYVAKPTEDKLGIDFEFSDGKAVAKKSFRFTKNSYLSQVNTEVTQSGVMLPHLLMWRGGFGDPTVPTPESVEHALYYDISGGKLSVKVAKDAKDGPVSSSGTYSFAGLEDTYFAGVFLPRENGSMELTTYNDSLQVVGSDKPEPRVGAGVGGDGRQAFELFVGPKDIQLLSKINPKLEQVVDWGWFKLLAKPLFLVLNWVNDSYVHSFGWAIILVTVTINMILLPLKFTSMKSAKKMQLIQPQIASINARYKNLSLRDPKKTEQNEEVMALYKKNGVNPLGGCLPVVLQIPFFIAFYKVLTVSIELRGAHWLWVTDLSQPEHIAIRLLPLILIATQFISQRMTPSPGMDPAQQKMMMLMPLGLGYMFYYQSSGLVLYWLTGNLVGIMQQYFTNKSMPTPAPVIDVKPVLKKKK